MKTKTKHKSRAVNDNKPVKRKWARSQKLRPLASGRVTTVSPKYSPLVVDSSHQTHPKPVEYTPENFDFENNPYLDAGYDNNDIDAEIYAKDRLSRPAVKPDSQPIFLLIFGFALTCIATLLYVFATNPETPLLKILIPAIIVSTTFLVAMRSTIALWASLLAITVWSALGAMAKYNCTPIPAGHWLIGLPVILSLQIIAASHSLSKFVMLASLACAYFWLGVFTLGSEMSALASGTLVFIFGTAHHRLGKAWEDKGLNHAHEHTLVGWIAAMVGLIWTQHYYIALGELSVSKAGIGANESFYWLLGIVLSLIAIFFSNLIRMSHNRMSFGAGIALCANCLILPALAYAPEIMQTGFERFSGLPATPYFGFAIGGIVLSLSIGLGANGLRRGRHIDVIIAGLMICAQTAMITNINYMNFDTLVVVFFAMTFILCAEIMLARRSILSA